MIKVINICGYPRSGTTLLAYKLNQISSFAAVPEAQFRFHSKVIKNNNLLDRYRSKKRIKKCINSWNEIAGIEMFKNKEFQFEEKLNKKKSFINLSIELLNHFHKEKLGIDFIIDHTPENLFGFDESFDFSNQTFFFLERSIKSIIESHKKVKWSNLPSQFIVAKYSIYHKYIDCLKKYLDNNSSLGYASIYYNDLLRKDWRDKIYFSKKKLPLEKILHNNKFDNKKFPLPSYTFNQHSYLDRILSKDFLIKEDLNKKQEFTYLRKAYNSFTLPGTILMLFNK